MGHCGLSCLIALREMPVGVGEQRSALEISDSDRHIIQRNLSVQGTKTLDLIDLLIDFMW